MYFSSQHFNLQAGKHHYSDKLQHLANGILLDIPNVQRVFPLPFSPCSPVLKFQDFLRLQLNARTFHQNTSSLSLKDHKQHLAHKVYRHSLQLQKENISIFCMFTPKPFCSCKENKAFSLLYISLLKALLDWEADGGSGRRNFYYYCYSKLTHVTMGRQIAIH